MDTGTAPAAAGVLRPTSRNTLRTFPAAAGTACIAPPAIASAVAASLASTISAGEIAAAVSGVISRFSSAAIPARSARSPTAVKLKLGYLDFNRSNPARFSCEIRN